MAYFGYPFDHSFMNLAPLSPHAQAYTLPTSMKLFPASFYHGSLVLVTLAFSLDIGLVSPVTMKNIFSD